MPKNKVTGKDRGAIVGYVRFALDADEMALLEEACRLEEHCRSDLARIYTMRYCRAVVAQFRQGEVMEKANDMMSWVNGMGGKITDEIAKKNQE